VPSRGIFISVSKSAYNKQKYLKHLKENKNMKAIEIKLQETPYTNPMNLAYYFEKNRFEELRGETIIELGKMQHEPAYTKLEGEYEYRYVSFKSKPNKSLLRKLDDLIERGIVTSYRVTTL
jgi:hypothetical protein